MNKSIILFTLLITSRILLCQDYEVKKYLDNAVISEICTVGDELWVATNGNGIYTYSISSDKWTNYSSTQGNLEGDFFYCIDGDENYIWAGSIDGLFFYNKKRDRWSKRKFGQGGQLANWIRAVAIDPNENAVWIGRFKYLSKFDLSSKRFKDFDLTIDGDEKTNSINTLKVDGDSLLWIGTEGGLHKYEKSKELKPGEGLTYYNNQYNFFYGEGEAVSVSSILIEQDNIWIGTDEFVTQENPSFNVGGLYKYDRKNEWTRFDKSSGLPGNGVFNLEKIGGYIFASIYQFGINTKEPFGRGLVLIDRVTNSIKPLQTEGVASKITAMLFYQNVLWLGTDAGIFSIDLKSELAIWK